jgi:hypothetical protein
MGGHQEVITGLIDHVRASPWGHLLDHPFAGAQSELDTRPRPQEATGTLQDRASERFRPPLGQVLAPRSECNDGEVGRYLDRHRWSRIAQTAVIQTTVSWAGRLPPTTEPNTGLTSVLWPTMVGAISSTTVPDVTRCTPVIRAAMPWTRGLPTSAEPDANRTTMISFAVGRAVSRATMPSGHSFTSIFNP